MTDRPDEPGEDATPEKTRFYDTGFEFQQWCEARGLSYPVEMARMMRARMARGAARDKMRPPAVKAKGGHRK
jgi:hypothetical protein